MGLISTESVTVATPVVEFDSFGEPIECGSVDVTIDGVVVCPGGTSELDASRPNGVEVAYTLCFPKSFTASLKGCRVNVRGTEYRVIGDPQRYDPANTPGDWNLTVEVGRTDG